ncbi:MAG: DUF58 domain-containing protein [Bacteroidota bacterium]
MIRLFRHLYITNRFFAVFGAILVLFVLSYLFEVLFPVAQALTVIALAVTLSEIFILFNPYVKVECRRTMPKALSLGSVNHLRIQVENRFGISLRAQVVDELPAQFQQRNFSFSLVLPPGEEKTLHYELRPLSRGEYHFGKVNIYVRSAVGLVERRLAQPLEKVVPVYPSILEMREYELKTIARISRFHGIKKMRRLGHSYEFEQIKNYVHGDDFRSINWKATGRKAVIMVNQFEDEKAQQVYSLIDNSRSMHMPFNGLSLLDYSINTSLVISNIALRKQDKAGLITFSDKAGTTLKAERSLQQIRLILDHLYKEQERGYEANYELLYLTVRNFIKGRSLLFLYTNFESYYALERVLPILRRLNRMHLLVVVFFENTEVADYSRMEAGNVADIYYQTIAQKFVLEKQQVVQQLRQYGIQSILTRPEDLSINTINKYLELKSRGMI